MLINCVGSQCTVIEANDFIASGAANFYEASFTFDSAWEIGGIGFALSAVFQGSGASILVSLGTYTNADPITIKIPSTVLALPGELWVGAIGIITGTPDTVLTTNLAFACNVPIGATDAILEDVSQSLIGQVLAAVSDAEAAAIQAEAAVEHYPIIDGGFWSFYDSGTDAWIVSSNPAQGATGDIGPTGPRGSRINTGTTITGTTVAGTTFGSSGITDALINDLYINTLTSNVYQCLLGGIASEATWGYICNIKGAPGTNGTDGVSVSSIVRTSGTGAAGTTDTYTITYSNSTTTTFNVYNGADGAGAVNSVNTQSGTVVLDGGDILMTHYTMAGTVAAILVGDSINAAIGKLEKTIDGIALLLAAL